MEALQAGNGRTLARAAAALAALALAAPAGAGASIIADGGDTSASAQAIESLPAKSSALIERPGDQDWYSIDGRPDDKVNAVFVRVLQDTPTCMAAPTLRIALFNPEGRWMRTVQAGTGDEGTMLIPANPSRYKLDVSALDPACAGLEYEVTVVPTDRPKPDDAASSCLVARAKRLDAQRRLRVLIARRARFTPQARPRYDVYVAEAERILSRARTSEKKVCE